MNVLKWNRYKLFLCLLLSLSLVRDDLLESPEHARVNLIVPSRVSFVRDSLTLLNSLNDYPIWLNRFHTHVATYLNIASNRLHQHFFHKPLYVEKRVTSCLIEFISEQHRLTSYFQDSRRLLFLVNNKNQKNSCDFPEVFPIDLSQIFFRGPCCLEIFSQRMTSSSLNWLASRECPTFISKTLVWSYLS